MITFSKLFFGHLCYNGGKKHNFEPRDSEEGVDWSRLDTSDVFWITARKIKTDPYKRTYRCDVCVWCGEIRRP